MEKQIVAYKENSITVHHRPGTTGEHLVFLHGGGLDHALLSWKEVIAAIGNQYDIHAIDLLGYGDSDKPDLEYSIPLYVDMLHEVLGQLHIEKTHLAGLSLGGGIGIGFALRYPQQVDRLVLVAAYGLNTRMPYHALCRWYVNSSFNSKSYAWIGKKAARIRWSIASSFFGNADDIPDTLVTELLDLCHEPKAISAWESFQRHELGKRTLTADLAPHLPELGMPVLLVAGEKDAGVPVDVVLAAGQLIRNSRVHVMKGCRHWVQKEKPIEFACILQDFLTEKPFR